MPDAINAATIARPAPASGGFDGIVPHLSAARRHRDTLRPLLGPRGMARIDLAHATGISLRSIEGYLDPHENKTPGLAHFLSLARTLPVGFADNVLALANIACARRQAAEAPRPRRVLSRGAHFVADMADKLEDGRLDHVEEAELRQVLGPFIEELQALKAALGREGS